VLVTGIDRGTVLAEIPVTSTGMTCVASEACLPG